MKNILLIIDMQNGFARYDQTKETGKKIAELLKTKSFDYVIATQFINVGGPYNNIIHWERLKTSPDIDLFDGINPDIVLKKYIYTAINQEFIQTVTRLNDNKKPENIFIVGVDTDCCVMKSAVDLFENNIRPIVLLDYCNSNGGEVSHQAGIQVMQRLIGKNQLVTGKINSTEDIKNILNSLN